MKSTLLAIAVAAVLLSLDACSSSKATGRRYFGEGGSSQDTLYVRALDRPLVFVVDRRVDGVGGSSQDTLMIKQGESGRIYLKKEGRDDKGDRKPK